MTAVETEPAGDVRARATRVAAIAAAVADSVDADARFPAEAVAALRAERMMSALIPPSLGGYGWSVGEVAEACTILGGSCSAAAMVFAMHQIQVACLVRHARDSRFFAARLAEMSDTQALIASVTSEIGVGGDVRSSVCAIDSAAGRFSVEKKAPVISYGAHADAFLLTARRAAEAPPSDQVLVMFERGDAELEQTGGWNTLGFRGTCSPGFVVRASGSAEAILPAPYAEISSETMLPVSHIVWSSLWLGIASAAVGRARAYVRAEARKSPGKTPAAAVRLAEVVAMLDRMRATVREAIREYESRADHREALAALGFAITMNNLKLSASTLLIEIVSQSMLICGMAAYKIDSPFALGRHLRDAFGAAIMINNDRIYGANAAMLLVAKDE